MKPVNAAVQTALKQSHNVYAKPRLTVEWNLNRHYAVTSANIPPDDEYGYEPEVFPIESIITVNRPTKGAAKARLSEAIIRDSYPAKQHVRYYLASDASKYKYWCSPQPTDSSGNFATFTSAWKTAYEGETGTPDNLTVVRPHILYDQVVRANKILIKTENSWASPINYEVMIRTTVGGAWTTVATSTGMNNATGAIELYWNGSSWGTTQPTGNLLYTNVAGIMLSVTKMGPGRDLDGNISVGRAGHASSPTVTTGNNSFFNLIEIAACMVADLTSKLISVDDTFDMSEASEVYPIGNVTANVANVTLTNLYNDVEFGLGSSARYKPGLFNNDNTVTPFRYLADQNAVFNLEYIYTVNNVDYPVQQFRMYSDPWSIGESEVSIPLRDYSKYFDLEPLPNVFWQDLTVSEILWRLCDMQGYVDYAVTEDTTNMQARIEYFWTDGEKTMWQVCEELSKATQTGIWFDAWGRMQIRSRDNAFTSATTHHTLRGISSGLELPNIISMEPEGEVSSNYATVTYNKAVVKPWTSASPNLDRVWEPNGNLVLRSTVLKTTLAADGTHIHLGEADVAVWPHTGLVQIQGEIIEYEGKGFEYYTYTKNKDANGNETYSNPVRNIRYPASKDELDNLHSTTPPQYRYRNSFNGRLKIKERGMWNSEIKAHTVEANGWTSRTLLGNGQRQFGHGFHHLPNYSLAQLKAPGNVTASNDRTIATRGNEIDGAFQYYGTRLRFVDDSRPDQAAGLLINNNGTLENGYYIEIQQSAKNPVGKNEIIMYGLNGSNGAFLGSDKGKAQNINFATFYDIDAVVHNVEGSSQHRIEVYVNGRRIFDVEVPASVRNNHNGKFGIFARGRTTAEFEYVYAVKKPPKTIIESTTFWDSVKGGYTGSHWDDEFVFESRSATRREKKKHKKATKRWNGRFMDEFGPWVHEVRQFDVKFDPFPALYSEPLSSNPLGLIMDYWGSAFGARFTIANMARRHVVLHGSDSLFSGIGGDSPDEICTIYARIVTLRDAEVVTVKDEQAIRERGKIESNIESPWIQSYAEAKAIGDWITKHWGKGSAQYSVTMFGNTLIEIGDVVSIDFPDQFMGTATHRFYVLAASSSWDNGIETTLRLRRIT